MFTLLSKLFLARTTRGWGTDLTIGLHSIMLLSNNKFSFYTAGPFSCCLDWTAYPLEKSFCSTIPARRLQKRFRYNCHPPTSPALLKFNKGLTPAEIGYIVAGVLGLVRIATGCGIVYYRKKRNGRDRRSADNMGGVEGGTFDRAGEHVQVDPETHNTPLTVRSHTLGREKKNVNKLGSPRQTLEFQNWDQ